ncbi:hypothetical protein AVEN_258411-1 [Araneus ventricosus]|uniref:Uncharacterized protein n=1 Tax=Araneus ventricosus TaxID=182803 RepID=A0A4Y2KD66_ARAVE|nr:hypothetical protein AVEN_258411-1 [Araneus ventricosus]
MNLLPCVLRKGYSRGRMVGKRPPRWGESNSCRFLPKVPVLKEKEEKVSSGLKRYTDLDYSFPFRSMDLRNIYPVELGDKHSMTYDVRMISARDKVFLQLN